MNSDNTRFNINRPISDSDSTSSVKSDKGLQPSADKDFRKIMGDREQKKQGGQNKKIVNKELGDALDEEEVAFEEESEQIGKSPSSSTSRTSLFDLLKEPSKKNANTEGELISQGAEVMETPSTLFKKLSAKDPKPKGQLEDYPNGNLEGLTENDLSKKGRIPSQFSQEQGDLSSVSQMAHQVQPSPFEVAVNSGIKKSQEGQRTTLDALIKQMVDAITEIKKSGETQTIVTLKHPPIFEGANLVITSSENAKGEFNIKFENLSPDAKQLMDMQQNQSSLRQALNEKNITIHIIIATTEVETPTITAQEGRFQRREDEDRSGGQRERQGQEENEEEEKQTV